jgi:hypothetical protein
MDLLSGMCEKYKAELPIYISFLIKQLDDASQVLLNYVGYELVAKVKEHRHLLSNVALEQCGSQCAIHICHLLGMFHKVASQAMLSRLVGFFRNFDIGITHAALND